MKLDRSLLRGFERIAVPVCERINRSGRLKDAIQATVGWANGTWIIHFTGRVWRVDGFEEYIKDLDAPHGIIVAANHRSFFDLYVCSSWLITQAPHLIRRLYCPVRTDFFYTKPVGFFMNFILSGGSMWPPVFRDEERRHLNRIGFAQLATVIKRGSFVGIHPEGKRSKDDDPYTLLPPKPGLGLLMQTCHPDTLVVPYYTLGLENSLAALIRRNFRPPGQRGTTVSLRWGKPIRVGDILEAHPDPLEATQFVMEHIHALGLEDKAMREQGSDAQLQEKAPVGMHKSAAM